ncbi:MAG: bifunctional phosphopantothenoylcysteine decarboxylase/phosphopantothenate--cysteine ligase CoaBC [Bacteroidota bacterium]|nr:bifunctional phosphopantothenoylcysteine decarboxylase/phosphopantothenate--cysteine ligase CoaBC [Bacteroidota bacterium]
MEGSSTRVERFLNRKVLLGVTGSIAAYKSANLVRELVKAGAEVQVILTSSAHDFITPLTLSTLSGSPVLTDLFVRDGSGRWNDHVHLARWADVLLIAPATANTLAKMAGGICDDLLLACYLSATCPVYIAPAMDLEMFRDASTTANLEKLAERGVQRIGPESGELASGLIGEGHMSEPEAIVDRLCKDLVRPSKLNGKRILITAGPTQEPIDPVRFISNRSSGKMGFTIAAEAALRGAKVQLVAGPVNLPTSTGVDRTDVITAGEMALACKNIAPDCDIVIMSAAVADHRPKKPSTNKLKKDQMGDLIELERTEDILHHIGHNKPEGQVVIGFALETDNALENAAGKLQAKNLDLLILNSLQDKGAGFGHDTNKITILSQGTDPQEFPLMTKTEVACVILDRLEELC